MSGPIRPDVTRINSAFAAAQAPSSEGGRKITEREAQALGASVSPRPSKEAVSTFVRNHMRAPYENDAAQSRAVQGLARAMSPPRTSSGRSAGGCQIRYCDNSVPGGRTRAY